jgi:hypothetical protein
MIPREMTIGVEFAQPDACPGHVEVHKNGMWLKNCAEKNLLDLRESNLAVAYVRLVSKLVTEIKSPARLWIDAIPLRSSADQEWGRTGYGGRYCVATPVATSAATGLR